MTLTYQDCLELKEHGFPQRKLECGCDGPVICIDHMVIPAVSTPTLSELIYACGGRMLELTRLRHSEPDKWCASAFPCEECEWHGYYEGFGTTPEQAVKNLFIALKKETV